MRVFLQHLHTLYCAQEQAWTAELQQPGQLCGRWLHQAGARPALQRLHRLEANALHV